MTFETYRQHLQSRMALLRERRKLADADGQANLLREMALIAATLDRVVPAEEECGDPHHIRSHARPASAGIGHWQAEASQAASR
jgi:hypothetical protein